MNYKKKNNWYTRKHAGMDVSVYVKNPGNNVGCAIKWVQILSLTFFSNDNEDNYIFFINIIFLTFETIGQFFLRLSYKLNNDY